MSRIKNKTTMRIWAKTVLDKRKIYSFADSSKVNNKLEKIIKKHKATSILFYLPMKHEINVYKLLKKKRKCLDIYVPFMVGNSFKMVTYKQPIKRSRFNINEPKNSFLDIKYVDMIIVPIIGVDKTYRRIGFGKGMYDKFYHKLKKKPIVIFVQNSLCFTSNIITNDYDIKANYLVTPKKLIIIK